MSSEVEINRNNTIPVSLPEVVLAAEEYDYGLNLISTMAATRENIVEPSTVMSILSASMTVGNKVIDVRDTSSSSSVANSPGSEPNEVSEIIVPTNPNDSEGVIVSLMDEQDDDVILVVQPIETIELLGDDDDDDGEGDVEIINTNEPIPKPKRLPQNSLKQLQQNHYPQPSSSNTSNIFPSIPRLPEPSVGSSFTFSDDEHLAPILKDLLDDHFGQIDFDLPLATNIQLTADHSNVSAHNGPNYGKSPRGLSVSLTNEIAIQTEQERMPSVKDMETQTELSAFCGKRKLFYCDNEGDGFECPICYEPWTNDEPGDHSLVSLKCGHLFGDSCLRKWLNDQHAQQKQRLCPVCRTRVEVKHIRTLYARRVIQIKNDPELKRLKQELEISKDRAKKYEALYKREKEKEKARNTLQTNVMHQRGSVPSNVPTLPPSLIVSPTNPNPIRTLSQVVPHLNVPTTSRGHSSNPPPYAIYPAPLVTTRQHIPRSDPIIRMLYDDFAHDYSTIPLPSANVMVERSINH